MALRNLYSLSITVFCALFDRLWCPVPLLYSSLLSQRTMPVERRHWEPYFNDVLSLHTMFALDALPSGALERSDKHRYQALVLRIRIATECGKRSATAEAQQRRDKCRSRDGQRKPHRLLLIVCSRTITFQRACTSLTYNLRYPCYDIESKRMRVIRSSPVALTYLFP